MKKITQFLTLAITICNSHGAFTMESQPNTHLLVIPGQNGMGGQNVDIVLPYFAKNNCKYLVQTPFDKPDFGQKNCQNFLKKAIEELVSTEIIHNNDRIILHGSSQGTATTINYAANNPQNIKALILESVMLTGNSAIFHTVDNVMLPEQYDLPDSSYYSLPYTAKAMYPSYSPTGEQPINNIDKLPNDLPIIILHDTKDFQLSFKDAQALYAYLTHVKKNKNVYLFSQESKYGEHINLLTIDTQKEISAINTILKLHGLLPSDSDEEINPTITYEYQPAVQPEWLAHFDAIFNKEQNLECIDTSLKLTSTSLGLYTLGKWLGM
jgi:hypothetical protein